jgi:endonuclease I
MKIYFKKILLFLIFALIGFSTLACDYLPSSSTTTQTTISDDITTGTWWSHATAIEISGTYKVVYLQGEDLDVTGLVVESINGLGVRTTLLETEYSISGYNKNTTGLQTVTISYVNTLQATLTATYVVYVNVTPVSVNFTLEVTPPTKTDYIAGDTVDMTGLIVKLVASDASFIILNDTQYLMTPINLSQAGEFIITIATLGLSSSFTIVVTGTLPLSTYYSSASGLTGNQLKLQLRTIIRAGFVAISYGESRYILDDTDRDPNNANNVILIYRGTSVSGVWDGGITWNREHVWPQSLLGVDVNNDSKNVGSDLQNLKPANPSENSSRSNKYFADTTTSISYAPRQEVKGDIARILFYMVIMYDYLTLVNVTGTQEPALYQMAQLNLLLLWHTLDPVDDFERNRNEIIFSYQKNRNPFIDYPEFVNMIWPQA